jgi:murein DD-endopeptidase MepM/ murein hydrolase activator NlpD
MAIKLTALPIKNMNLTEITGDSAFGARIHPITKTMLIHEGIDISQPMGTPIYAAADGKVIVSKMQNDKKGYGNYIVIRHNDEFDTLYAHLSTRTVKAGDLVKAGALIGYVGSTGDSTGPHLHFGVCMKFLANPRGWMDPLPLLRICKEELDEVVRKIIVEINGNLKEVNSILKNDTNYVLLRDLSDIIDVSYDERRKMPIIKSKC